MKTRTYQVIANYGAGGNATAYLDVVADGYIVGLEINLTVDYVATATSICEVSTQGLFQGAQNNALGIIGALHGYGKAGENKSHVTAISGLAIPIKQGNRIYVNSAGNVNNNSSMRGVLHVSE